MVKKHSAGLESRGRRSQRGASFNLGAVKADIEERLKAMKGKME
jgi:hypothetical protein